MLCFIIYMYSNKRIIILIIIRHYVNSRISSYLPEEISAKCRVFVHHTHRFNFGMIVALQPILPGDVWPWYTISLYQDRYHLHIPVRAVVLRNTTLMRGHLISQTQYLDRHPIQLLVHLAYSSHNRHVHFWLHSTVSMRQPIAGGSRRTRPSTRERPPSSR